MRARSLLILLLAGLLLSGLAGPRTASAAVPIGGALDAPGEKSHTVALGWPEISYTWEALVRERVAFGPRAGIQIWPLALSLGAQARFKITERGPLSLAFLVAPAFAMAGYGGSKAVYLQNYNFGRSRTLRPSLGPQLNLGLLATIDISDRFKALVTFENPVALWVWTQPRAAWWLEWPVLFTGGVEYRISYAWSVFGRIGGGPALGFAGNSLLLGVHWHLMLGAQVRY